ncbi:hypothetical protein MBLNU459_g5214t1 [Dothideomycetes sp. NU459]
MAFLARIRNSAAFQRILRVLQFLSALISLALFSARLYKILLTARRASRSNGAVEGILAAAVLYSLIAMLLKFAVKHIPPMLSNILRWVLIFFDVLFVIAFIAVAVLTRPGGSSGPCTNTIYRPLIPKGQNCNLPWGTFILAIVSTLLHLITAIFHQVKENRNQRKQARAMEQAQAENGYGHGGQHTNGRNGNDPFGSSAL